MWLVPLVAVAATIQVDMVNFAFVPESLTIGAEDTVLWINQTPVIHTATSGNPISCTPDGIWDSGNMAQGDSFTYVFENEGIYPYFCIPHCAGGMTGNIEVLPVAIDQGDYSLGRSFIFQAAPNPVIGNTTLKYTLPENTYMSIIVFNLSGKEVRVLVNERKDAGIHTMVWDGRDNSGRRVPSGTYFLRLEAGRYTATKKLTVMR
jgi:plastocyanin